MKLPILKNTALPTYILIGTALFGSIIFCIFYFLGLTSASSSSDAITGIASFSDPNNVHIQVNFHRTNNSAYLGFLGCHLANQFYPVGGSPNSTSYTLNKIVPATLFAANATLNCTGSEYSNGKPFATATASFSPYGVIDGEAYLQNPTSNTTIQLSFHRLDNQAFLGFFYCGVSGHAFPVGGSPSSTKYSINQTVPTSWFSNNAQLVCTGSQYYNGKGATVKIAQKNYSPYDQISGGVSLSGTTVNVAIHFHRPDNSHFLGYLSCRASSINLSTGGTSNSTDYYVHGSYPAAAYGTSTMVCNGSEYRGSTPVLTATHSFASPYIPQRTGGGGTPTPTPTINSYPGSDQPKVTIHVTHPNPSYQPIYDGSQNFIGKKYSYSANLTYNQSDYPQGVQLWCGLIFDSNYFYQTVQQATGHNGSVNLNSMSLSILGGELTDPNNGYIECEAVNVNNTQAPLPLSDPTGSDPFLYIWDKY